MAWVCLVHGGESGYNRFISHTWHVLKGAADVVLLTQNPTDRKIFGSLRKAHKNVTIIFYEVSPPSMVVAHLKLLEAAVSLSKRRCYDAIVKIDDDTRGLVRFNGKSWDQVDTVKLICKMAGRMKRLGVPIGGFLPTQNAWGSSGNSRVASSFGFIVGNGFVF